MGIVLTFSPLCTMYGRATDCICVCFGYALDSFGVGRAPFHASCLSYSAPHEADQVAKF